MEALKIPDVRYQAAIVQFPLFGQYKALACEIAAYINAVEITEDNVKDVKKDLADARKVTDGLNRKRIDIKKEILSQFDEFEAQIKELGEIIGTAEAELRAKLKVLEEQERERKKEQIREIWDKRIVNYNVPAGAFDRWLTSKHLNKTETMSKVEADMVEWLEMAEHDIAVTGAMGDNYLVEYLATFDLRKAIENVRSREKLKETIKTMDIKREEISTFIVYGNKDAALAEMLMRQHNINFKKGE